MSEKTAKRVRRALRGVTFPPIVVGTILTPVKTHNGDKRLKGKVEATENNHYTNHHRRIRRFATRAVHLIASHNVRTIGANYVAAWSVFFPMFIGEYGERLKVELKRIAEVNRARAEFQSENVKRSRRPSDYLLSHSGSNPSTLPPLMKSLYSVARWSIAAISVVLWVIIFYHIYKMI